MKQWLVIDKVTGRVKGWHRSGKATAVPADQADREFIEVTDAEIAAVEAAQQAASIDGQGSTVFRNKISGVVAAPADTRINVRVTIPAEMEIGVPVSVTLLAEDKAGKRDRKFSGTMIMDFFEEPHKFTFAAGDTTRNVTPLVAGHFEIRSNRTVRIVNPTAVTVFK